MNSGYIFEITDKTGKLIHLSKERWNNHIKIEHPDMVGTDEIIRVLKEPDSIINLGEEKVYFYKYYKNRKFKSKYLKIIVKYLNGSGYVITAYFARNIRKK